MTMITEKQLLELKRKAEQGKNTYIEASATFNEVQRNIESYNNELKEMGIDPDKAEEILAQKEAEIMEKYNSILAKFPQE